MFSQSHCNITEEQSCFLTSLVDSSVSICSWTGQKCWDVHGLISKYNCKINEDSDKTASTSAFNGNILPLTLMDRANNTTADTASVAVRVITPQKSSITDFFSFTFCPLWQKKLLYVFVVMISFITSYISYMFFATTQAPGLFLVSTLFSEYNMFSGSDGADRQRGAKCCHECALLRALLQPTATPLCSEVEWCLAAMLQGWKCCSTLHRRDGV